VERKMVELFSKINEPFVVGYFEDEDRSDFYRFSKAIRRFYEARELNPYEGTRIYPSGLNRPGQFAVEPNCAKTFNTAFGGKPTAHSFYDMLKEKSQEAADIMLEIREKHNFTLTPRADTHTLSGYTHTILHYSRVIYEGLDSYIPRINRIEDTDIKDGLLELLEGLRNYHARCLQYLKEVNAPKRLVTAYEHVPFHKAEDIYEALVCINFIMYLDNCDNIGCIDQDLYPLYRGENVVKEIREIFENMSANYGDSCTIGPYYNELSRQILVAVKGLFRPMLELIVSENMPEDMWNLALDAVYTRCGQPAFYNSEKVNYLLSKVFPEASEEELRRFSGSGCTEPNIAGYSNVGGIDANINIALVFERYMKESLASSTDFENFYTGFIKKLKESTDMMVADVYQNHINRSLHLPNPIRTLFVDDCIDKGLDFNNGGTRYNAALSSESGMVNTIDSFLAIKDLVFNKHLYTPSDFLKMLEENDPVLIRRIRECPHYGLDDCETNDMAYRLTNDFYSMFEDKKCYRGGKHIPSSHQHKRHGPEGIKVGIIPDSRAANEALNDSIAPMSGKFSKGPTAALISATHYCQNKVLGVPVYNMTIGSKFSRQLLEALIKGYFKAGGTQIQITVTSKEEILDAINHPEKHEDLIIRVGGYSEYFNRLSPEIKKSVYERTMYE